MQMYLLVSILSYYIEPSFSSAGMAMLQIRNYTYYIVPTVFIVNDRISKGFEFHSQSTYLDKHCATLRSVLLQENLLKYSILMRLVQHVQQHCSQRALQITKYEIDELAKGVRLGNIFEVKRRISC